MSIQTPAGSSFLGRYRPVSYLGSGGMADVFRCELQGIGGFGKACVVKRMKPELVNDESFVSMFLDEARLVARLNHPNIVQVFEIDQANGVPFIAMELIRGPTLSKLLRLARKANNVPIELVARVIADAALGLSAAHAAFDEKGSALNIVHRDISPQNLMVSAEGVTKVLDFGVAKAEGKLARTATGTLKGKVGYMAPEQIAGHAVDGRADVYALGVCLYQGLVGRMPFPGNNDVEVLRARLIGEWPSALSLRPDLPAELDAIITEALASEPQDRTASAIALHDRLDAFLNTYPMPSDRKAVSAWVAAIFPAVDELVAGSPVSDLGLAAMTSAAVEAGSGGLTPRSQPSAVGSAPAPPTWPTASVDGAVDPISVVSVVQPVPSAGNPVRRAAIIAGAVGGLGAFAVFGTSALLLSLEEGPSSTTTPVTSTVAATAPAAGAPALATPPEPQAVTPPDAPAADATAELKLDDLDVPAAAPPTATTGATKVPPQQRYGAIAGVGAGRSPTSPKPGPAAVAATTTTTTTTAPTDVAAAPPPAPVAATTTPEPVPAPTRAPTAPVEPPAPPKPALASTTTTLSAPPAAPTLPAAETPSLPAKQRVYAVNDLIAACKKIELELKTHGHLPASTADNVTAVLAKALVARVSSGDAVDVPSAAAYWFVSREARAGRSRSAIAANLAQAFGSGALK
jgi:serine/threonine-protein kinase